jgi:hypothetical protein
MNRRMRNATIAAAGALATTAGLVLAGVTTADAAPAHGASGTGQFTVSQILSGTTLHHTYTPAGGTGTKTEPLTLPDDITQLGGDLFTAFQNGVGPQGQPSTDGNTDSTVVEFTPADRAAVRAPGHRHRQRGRQLQRLHDRPRLTDRAADRALQLQQAAAEQGRHRRDLHL